MVNIQPDIDNFIDRSSYDADLFAGNNDGPSNDPTTIDYFENDLTSLSVTDIHNFMDLIKSTDNHSVKQFTTAHLKQHINDHWRLKMRVQMDSGASDCITNDRNVLKQYRNVKSRHIDTADATSTGCRIEGEGFMDILTSSGDWLTIKTLYVPNASGTIISPTYIAKENKNFTSWHQLSHTDTGTAQIEFFHRHEYRPNVIIHMYQHNNCWYIDQSYLATVRRVKGYNRINPPEYTDDKVLINSLNKTAEYEIWHQRLLHPGHTCMDTIHQCVDGVPKLKRHNFHTCPICQESKIAHEYNHEPSKIIPSKVGELVSMDYGFVKATNDNKMVRSHDGYSSYILIVDHATRYMWVFLTKNKCPPIHFIDRFLRTYGLQDDTVKIVRTDQGGELARSTAFCQTVAQCGYQVEITGTDNSSQNGKVERPHQTLAAMMRSSLSNASLHKKYWSDALLHSVYIKNRLPHYAFKFKSTPYTALTGTKPDLSNLKIFGSRITVRKPGLRKGKVNSHHYNGIFLRYAKTMKNYVYIDVNTNKIKTATHAVFDEAHYSQPTKPRGAQILMNHGYVL